MVAHHVAHKNRAGDWVETPDGRAVGNLTPCCAKAHRRIHRAGKITFQKAYSVDLADTARQYGDMAPVDPPEK